MHHILRPAGTPIREAERVSVSGSSGNCSEPARQQDTSPATIDAASADYRQWDEPWRSLWLKTPHEPRIVWTYYELGAHMGGKPDPLCRDLLQTLMLYFRWPKGTIAFWPATELRAENVVPRPDMFWQGVTMLGATQLALFGRDVCTLLLPDAPEGRTPIKFSTGLVHVCPSLARLRGMLPHERLLALQALKDLPF
ncbi:MAG: hypothetical protein V3573_13700 [Desulfovibrionaceae bacterium]